MKNQESQLKLGYILVQASLYKFQTYLGMVKILDAYRVWCYELFWKLICLILFSIKLAVMMRNEQIFKFQDKKPSNKQKRTRNKALTTKECLNLWVYQSGKRLKSPWTAPLKGAPWFFCVGASTCLSWALSNQLIRFSLNLFSMSVITPTHTHFIWSFYSFKFSPLCSF